MKLQTWPVIPAAMVPDYYNSTIREEKRAKKNTCELFMFFRLIETNVHPCFLEVLF
jgi:hypothetical protein